MASYYHLSHALRSAGLVDRVVTRLRMAFADAAKRDNLVSDFYNRWERRASEDLIEENRNLAAEGVGAALIEKRSRSFDDAVANVRQNKSDLLRFRSSGPI